MTHREVFYEIFVPGRYGPSDTSNGSYPSRKQGLAALSKMRGDFPGAFLTKVIYEVCPETVTGRR